MLLSLSRPRSDTKLAVGHVPASESNKRRRISGLNSRFDHMLWEASLTTRTLKSLRRSHKHAYSSSSSSTSNHELATTSTHASKDMELKFGGPEASFVVLADEIQSHGTMQQMSAGLSSLSNNRDQVLSDVLPWAMNVEHLTV